MGPQYLFHKIDAAHIRNIGEQSVSNKIQAVLELVKNSYDADATSCEVIFYGVRTKNKKIKIEKISIKDDGIGMTKTDIQTKLLTVGTSSKRLGILSPKFLRRVSGEKGMGHYSVQRLGNKIRYASTPEILEDRLVTDEDKKSTYVLEIDWNQYKDGLDFEKIQNKFEITTREKTLGTRIEITDLKDEWNAVGEGNDLELLSASVQNLVLPKKLQTSEDHGFFPIVGVMGFEINLPEKGRTLLDYALYKIDAKLRGQKVDFTMFERQKNEEEFKQLPTIDPLIIEGISCGDADVEIYWFPGGVTKWTMGAMAPRILKDQLKEYSGIKIYNDNVRIMPYGEPNNDWLGLDTRKSGSESGGKVRNKHLIGFVTLSREKNREIIETTSRQALEENKAFQWLKTLLIKVIEQLEKVRQEKEANKDEIHHTNLAMIEINHVMERILQEDIYKDSKKEYIQQLKNTLKHIESAEKEKTESLETFAENIEMYRNLSTVGTQVIAFNHEIINPIRFIKHVLESFKDKKISNLPEVQSQIDRCIQHAENSLNWANFIREFSSLLSGASAASKSTTINIQNMINELRTGFASILEVSNIKIEEPIFIGEVPKIKMKRSSLESILINLISNSIRALKKVNRNKIIRIEVSTTPSDVVINFQDNGIGIPDENRKRIFDPFFTTYTDPEDKGTGMGLTIIKEIVENEYGGKIRLKKTIYEKIEPGNGMTQFEILLPRSGVLMSK